MDTPNTISSDQITLNQLQYDLLSLPFHTANHEAHASMFLNDDLSTDNSNLNYCVSAPSDYCGTTNVPESSVSFLSQDVLPTPMEIPGYITPLIHPHQEDIEVFLTPLVSPAITPSYTDIYQFLDPSKEQYFTPLSSPALLPNQYADDITNSSPSNTSDFIQNAALLTQLTQIETKQQLLRDQIKTSPAISPTYRKSPLTMFSNRSQAPPSPLPFNNGVKRRSTTLRQKIILASPQLHSSKDHHIHCPTTPATPASLMNMSHHIPSTSSSPSNISSPFIVSDQIAVDNMPFLPPAAVPEPATPLSFISKSNKARKLTPSPSRTLKPLVSPFLQPDLRRNSGSNNLIAARVPSGGIETRRSAHKVAEQRRRDTLKQSFDSLRKEITDVLVMDSGQPELHTLRQEKEKEVKLMSKVLLLQHSYEHIIRLKTDSRRKDDKMATMKIELERLRGLVAQQKVE